MATAIAYYRVSTREQGNSGLGLAAQKRAVETFCQGRDFELAPESFKDIESGSHNDRPGLLAALAACKATGATLVIAKLDRLSRNAAFVLTLRDSGVAFVAADLPEANTLTVGLMALLAQQEREMISTRTKAALAEIKASGRTLGVPPGTDRFGVEGREKAAKAKRAKALARANGALHTAVALRAEGWTYNAIAEHLEKSGHKTPTGQAYAFRSVRHLLALAAA